MRLAWAARCSLGVRAGREVARPFSPSRPSGRLTVSARRLIRGAGDRTYGGSMTGPVSRGRAAMPPRSSIRRMQPTAMGTPGRFQRHLDALRDHAALGPPVRFYLRRREQVLYLVVGGWNTVFGYAVWALLQYLLGDYLPYLVILLLAWPINVLNAYLGYRYVVFRSRGPVFRELPRFSLVYVVALVANLVLLPVAVRVLPFSIYVDQALFLAVVLVCSYLGHKYFSFRGGRRPQPDQTPSDNLAAVQK
jgi:putative flippase GtrA